MIADVIINRPARALNNALSYLVPDALGKIPVGTRVVVPLQSSKEEGIIVGYRDHVDFPLKPIISVLDESPWFTEEMLATAKKISEYFLCSTGEALRLFTVQKNDLKPYTVPREKWYYLEDGVNFQTLIDSLGRKKKAIEILSILDAYKEVPRKFFLDHGFSSAQLKQVEELSGVGAELLPKDTKTEFRRLTNRETLPLNEAQEACFTPIAAAISAKDRKTFLLHGVTGSGKTQVYIRSAQHCLEEGNSCLVMVPEIVLTHQIVQRFVQVFGDEVVVFHSKMTIAERNNNWQRVRRGESHIIIGARSSVFAPVTDLGLIIIDEEHDSSYKQEDMTHYDARKVAQFRAEAFSCPVLLGSATPSITSYYQASAGEYELLTLPHRVFDQPLPSVQIVDMKEELFFGNYSVLSSAMRALIEKTLAHKEQMILLLNRRGYSTFVMCRSCGHTIECPHCDTSMIYHKAGSVLKCHYCEYTMPVPKECPACGSQKVRFFGSGTQQLEEVLEKDFPHARIARLDLDVTKVKGAAADILEEFSAGHYDILLGTQMVAKGHDFKNVTAVGVITADSTLHLPQYTAAERTFSLLTQVAGRAGRGGKEGHVVIQTYQPSHYAIIESKDQNYKAFYEEEIKYRKALGYPPFGQMVHLLFRGTESRKVYEIASRAAAELIESFPIASSGIEIFGPYEEVMTKMRDQYRWSVMIRGKDLAAVKQFLYQSWIFTEDQLVIDVDPI